MITQRAYRQCRAGLLLAAACAFVLSPAGAAPPPWNADLQHTGWTRKDGAPTGLYSMAQDGNGMLWFAASDGLYSFDGVRFVRNDSVYGHALDLPGTIAVAAYGETIWVSYQFGGISRFERSGARHYTDSATAPKGTVFQFVRMPDGTLWAAGASGLYRLDGDAWRQAGPADGLPEGALWHLTLLRDGSMLVYHPDAVYRSVAGASPSGYRFEKVLDRAGINGGELLPDGSVLVYLDASGMHRFDPATGRLTPYALHEGGTPNMGFCTDAHGGLWVSTGEAIQLFDAHGKLVRQFVPAEGFTGTTFGANLTDREGNVWFATANGVDRVRKARLSALALPGSATHMLGITPDYDGAVWIGILGQPGEKKVPSLIVGADGTRRTTDIVGVTSSHRQADGTLWFANNASLWRRKDGVTRRWPLPASFVKDPAVQSMTTAADGTLWLSVGANGVHTFRDGVWRAGGGRPELAKPTAISLATDHQGRIWFGYPGNRIAVFDGKQVRRFGRDDGLVIGNTLAIVAGKKHVWIGGDLGLARFDGTRFVTLGERYVGGFRGVSGIVERAGGELWLHDTGGLARIAAHAVAGTQVAVERFNHLDGHRGMPNQLRPLPSLIEATDGRLWYATSGGVGHIDPRAIPRNPRPPTVLINAIRTDGKVYAPHPGLMLPPHTSRLEIDFTATALSMPERVRFRYRLAGLDDQWRDAGGLRQAVYTNLDPGAYTFEVTAANEDGVWSAAPVRARFSIEPAFVQTIWFKLVCALAALAALWLLLRWRLRRIEARLHDNLRVRMLERERIARALHDTFIQSVQALVLRMHVLLGKLPHESGVRDEVETVLARAENVIDEGRERVKGLRVPTLHHGRLPEALGDSGRELAAACGVPFDARVTGTRRELDPETEDELYTIAREALSNAFHHARASRVTLALDYRADDLRLAIVDDGCGIPAEVLASGARAGHWGLPGMRERARLANAELVIDSSARGTSVSVHAPYAVSLSH